jgi:hypothetical protein
MIRGRVAPEAPCKAARRRNGGVGAFCLSELLVLSQPPEYTIFAASLLMPTPFHAVKFGDAPCCYAMIGRVMTLRATNLRTRRPRSAVQGGLAPAAGGAAQVLYLNFKLLTGTTGLLTIQPITTREKSRGWQVEKTQVNPLPLDKRKRTVN